jgi:trehalose-phosphatase
MKHLFQSWPDVAQRIRQAQAVALFLDFDGTLAPFVPQPCAARLPGPTRRVLQRLAWLPGLRVWIVSARRADDLRSRIGVPQLQYLGLYGWENGNAPRFEAAEIRGLAEARDQITHRIRHIPGIRIEDKDATFALHWRGAPQACSRQAAHVLTSVMAQFDRVLRVMVGDHVWEVAPASLLGKGAAVRLHWRAWHDRALPIYLGDAMADEAAFTALASGITVRIGRARPTRAHFQLRDTAEVRTFLERLEEELR